jgi:hypothetical protein
LEREVDFGFGDAPQPRSGIQQRRIRAPLWCNFVGFACPLKTSAGA